MALSLEAVRNSIKAFLIESLTRSVRNAQASHQHRRDLVIVGPAKHASGLCAIVRSIEGGFFQAIHHQTGEEAGIEEDVQGTVEVVVGDGLAEHGDAFLRAGVQVFGDLDGVGRDEFSIDCGFLGTQRHTGVVEAGMAEGEDKAATGFDDLANAAHQGVDLGHIHDGHVADGCIEALLTQGDDLVLAGGVDEAVFDAVGVFRGAGTGTFEELCTEVGGDDMNAQLGHTAGEDTVAAGDLEHGFARLQVEQAFARGTHEDALEVVAVAHVVVPECGVLVPDIARVFVQISWLGCVFGSHLMWFPFWYIRHIFILALPRARVTVSACWLSPRTLGGRPRP